MAPTRVSADVLAAADRGGVKVVALGDSGQLSSVEAGGWLGALSQRLGAHELRAVVRQRDPAERGALAAAARRRAGSVARAQAGSWGVGGSPRRPAGGPGGGHGRLAGRRGGGGDRAGDHDRAATTKPAPRLNDEARAWRDSRGRAGRTDRGGRAGGGGGRPGDRAAQRPRARRRQRHPRHRPRRRPRHAGGDHRDRRRRVAPAAGATTSPSTSSTPTRSPGMAVRARPWSGRWSSATPEDFTNEWAYTALSRARDPRQRPPRRRTSTTGSDRSEIAPEPARPDRRGGDRRDASGDGAPRARGARHRPGRRRSGVRLCRAKRPPRRTSAPNGNSWRSTSTATWRSTEPVPEVLEPCAGPSRCGRSSTESAWTRRAERPSSAPARRSATFRARRSPNGPSGSTRCSRRSPTTESRRRDEQTSSLASANDQREAHETHRPGAGTAGPARPALADLRPPRTRVHRTSAGQLDRTRPANTTSRSQSSLRASTPTATSAQPGSTSTATSSSSSLPQRSSCATATASPASAASTTSAATRPRGSPSDWVRDPTTPPRASNGTAPPPTSTTTATPSDSRPANELPDRGDYRQRHAWEDVHKDAAKALEMHPERPLVERPPPELTRDIGLGIDL